MKFKCFISIKMESLLFYHKVKLFELRAVIIILECEIFIKILILALNVCCYCHRNINYTAEHLNTTEEGNVCFIYVCVENKHYEIFKLHVRVKKKIYIVWVVTPGRLVISFRCFRRDFGTLSVLSKKNGLPFQMQQTPPSNSSRSHLTNYQWTGRHISEVFNFR